MKKILLTIGFLFNILILSIGGFTLGQYIANYFIEKYEERQDAPHIDKTYDMCSTLEKARKGIIVTEQADGSLNTKVVEMSEADFKKLKAFSQE